MNFIIYDIALLVLFGIFFSILLYKKRKNLKQEGPLLLYRTSWGIKLIEKIGKKYQRTLRVLSYVSVGLGYILMTSILFLIIQTVYIYLTSPIARIIRVPPLMPLIPYFPRLFGLDSIFPPFYFIYFVIAIAIVATIHEFSHGIFARRYNIGIKSTGFAFFKYFPAFFGAFVEQDEKQMKKKRKFEQMSILSAGVFANIVTTIIFFIILVAFFSYAFIPSGVIFDDYSYSIIEITSITLINNISLNNPSYDEISSLVINRSFNEIKAREKNYVGIKGFSEDLTKVALYDDAPAINAKLSGAIVEINGIKTDGLEKLGEELLKYSPGEKIVLGINDGEGMYNQDIILGKNPKDENSPWLGIGFISQERSGIIGKSYEILSSFKKPHIYYESKFDGISLFVYNLIWWIVLINLLVALFNMLPMGFLDGGMFFYLTIEKVTKSKKIAGRIFSLMTRFILFLGILLMIKWIYSFFF